MENSWSKVVEYFSVEGFMPHGHCYLWKPDLLLVHVISDSIIVIAYYSIPLALTYVVYKSQGRLPFNRIFLLFSIFILACGTSHLMEIINIWKSEYYLSGLVKLITAIASILTAIYLWPLLPQIIKAIKSDNEI